MKLILTIIGLAVSAGAFAANLTESELPLSLALKTGSETVLSVDDKKGICQQLKEPRDCVSFATLPCGPGFDGFVSVAYVYDCKTHAIKSSSVHSYCTPSAPKPPVDTIQ